MQPIDFPQSTCVLAKDQPEYLPLPVHYKDGVMTSCWKLTWMERIKLLWTGRLWFEQMTFGEPLQPQLPRVDGPFA